MTGGDLLFCLCCIAFLVIYLKFTTPAEREANAQRRHEFNNRVLGGGFNVLGFFLKRLK